MLALGLLLNFAGIGLFCWLIFTLAVYALPFFVGLTVFMMALHGGAGILGAPLVGIAACGMTLAIGQTAFAMTRSVIIRAIIAALFAVPATPARSIRTRQSGAILNRFSQPQHISNDPAPSARRPCRLQPRAERRPASLSEM
jgi:hypothetical protein